MKLEFEWDDKKAQINFDKHGVNFEEAKTVFDDPFALIFDDPVHSFGEQREIIIGYSTQNRLLLVCFTERNKNVIRIFSSRLTTKKERQDYEQNTIR
ncbi:BrnT family toxin [Anabaena sphaerica FACHB-251]|uniref:BrnT family toxin n=1 Tax=Anabaena sphaerica FACHB-251 TaxID=2692883 RepID=A0A926WFR9_9NOST|nr:BrnT family toxin [Anabaena sphaerica]MBD2293024.1 BrnT family toxin [Anabaena sphaerica FACHB-251]